MSIAPIPWIRTSERMPNDRAEVVIYVYGTCNPFPYMEDAREVSCDFLVDGARYQPGTGCFEVWSDSANRYYPREAVVAWCDVDDFEDAVRPTFLNELAEDDT